MSPLPTTINTTNPRAQGLHARINSNFYRLTSLGGNGPNTETADLQASRIDTAANPEDFRPEFGDLYSISDFTGGLGLDFAHRRGGTDRDFSRYWTSERLNVIHPDKAEPSDIRLAPDPETVTTTTVGNARVAGVEGSNADLFVTDGTQLLRIEDVEHPTAFTVTAESPHVGEAAATVQDIVSFNGKNYAALESNGVHERSGGVWTHYSDLTNARRLWVIKERIIAAAGSAGPSNQLYELGPTTTSTLLHTLETNQFWKDVVESGGFILASASDGFLYIFTLDEDTGTIALSSRQYVQDLDHMFSVPGSNIIYFSQRKPSREGGSTLYTRLMRGLVSDSGTITGATVVHEFKSVDPIGPFVLVDNDIFFIVPGLSTGIPNTIWRYNLSTGGRFEYLQYDDNVTAATLSGPRGGGGFFLPAYSTDRVIVFAVNGLVIRDATGASGDPIEASGYFITPLIDHFSATEKSWHGASFEAVVPNPGSIEIYYSINPDDIRDPNAAGWTLLTTLTADTDIDVEFPIGLESRYIAFKVVINQTTSSSGPRLRALSVRSFPGPGDLILTLPINTSDQIEIPGRKPITIPHLGEQVHATLANLEGTSVEAELFDPAETIRGVVDKVATQVPMVSVDGSKTLTTMVRIRGRRV